MSVLIEIGASIAAKIARRTFASVAHQVGYLLHYKRNIENLETQVTQLSCTKERLQHSVDDAVNNGKQIEADVQEWLTGVGRKIEEAKVLIDERHLMTRCSSGSFTNFVSRRRHSRDAKKMAQDLETENRSGRSFDNVSFRLPPQGSIEIRGYESFDTRMPILLGIKEALTDPSVTMIGVYGMPGIGKTMLAKEVARQANEEELFSKVIVVTVSQTPSHEKIQIEVAENLGLKLDEKTLSVRASRLRDRLLLEKKTLIILDDVWEKLGLEEVGICFGVDQKGCKILITSRFEDLLLNDMSVEKNFHVEVLSNGEAARMFNKIVGNTVANNEVKRLATEIVAQCGGLPLAIATVGHALKNKSSIPIWENALQELEASNPVNIKGMNEKVYSSIRLSYDYLRSEEEKSLLLLCSLHDEDANININFLVRYCMGLGWFNNITELEHARNRVISLVESLKSSCLLLDGDYRSRVKMHDVVRDVVISITSTERHMYNVMGVTELEELLSKNKLQFSTAISLLGKKNDCLPEKLDCPQLEFFMWRNNRTSGTVPDNFFEEAKMLKVLDLAFAFLEPLPSSFGSLENLRTLCLFHASLEDIVLIGELKNLEVLDLSWSNIEQLPANLGQLCRLKLLDLRFCSRLEVIEPNVLARLTRLEELNMESSFTNWNGLRARGSERNASLDELKELLRLTTLHVCVLDVNCLPENLFGENLKRYKVLIGDEVLRHCKLESSSTSRILKVKLNKSNLLNKGGLKVLLERSEELYLDGLEDVNNVVFELDKGGFEELKHLEFANNANIQFIVNSTEQINHFSAFPSLESLILDKLTSLEKICHGNLAAESFRNLRVIKVRKCDGLKSLFPLSIAMHLEIIEVIDCKRIDKVIIYEREDPSSAAIDKVKFLQLRSLCLGQLPELIQFFCKAKESSMLGSKDASSVSITSAIPFFIPEVELPSLEYMKLSAIKYDQKLWTDQLLNELERDGLRQLKELIVENIVGIRFIVSSSNQQIPSCAFPSLESLHLENLMQLEKICDAKLAQQSFCKLKYVKVIRCNRLKNLWSFSISNAPSQLEELEVTDCNMMEEIFSCAEEEDTASVIELSQLLSLKLISASKLKQFCSTSPKKTERSTADSGMPFFNGKVNFPKLETLEICSLNFQKLWEDDSSLQLLSSPASFRNLTKVLVKGCRFMKNLFPSSVAANLVALRRIDVQECDMMEEILSVDDGTHKIIFHKLNVLTFANLPKLTRFSTGIIIEFPELLELTPASCPDLKTLIVSDSTSQTTVSFFNEKVAIPKLEKLVITCMDNLEAIWQSEALTAVSFTELKVIKIYECKNLTNMFPPYMLGRLHSLRRLGIRICALLKEVFQVQSSNNTINLSNLQATIIYGCPSLKCLLPLSVARGLLRLEKLEINGCNIHEVVCAEVGVVDTTPRFLFPQLTSSQLRMLPELLHFYPRPHTSDWPLLKSLKVYNCKKLMAFPFEFRGLQGGRKLGSPPNVPIQPLISMKKVSFPNLEELILGNLASEGNTSHGQFSRLLGEEESADMAPSLRILEIFELPTLTHLWAENSSNSTLWSSKKLAPSSPSLQNLTTLRVSKCHGMLNLLTSPSSAKNLTQLTRMSIAECERMEEIIGDSGAECEITFNGLEILVLHDLLSLKSFHSGNCIMRFPNSKLVIVSRCSEMEKFSFRAITPKLDRVITGIKDQEIWQETNVGTYFKKINHVYLIEESSWDGDINTTIQHIRERDLGAAIQRLFLE